MRTAIALVLLIIAGTIPLHTVSSSMDEDPDLPDGCAVEVEAVIGCHWNFELEPDDYFRANLSWVETAIVTLRITPASADAYAWGIYDEDGDLIHWESFQTEETSGVYFLDKGPDGEYHFYVYHNYGVGLPTEYDVELVFEIKDGDERPETPAGTPDDPQLIDSGGDATPRHMDITGGWFDQPYLDDGLIEVGLVVPYLHEAGVDEEEVLAWNLRWSLLGHTYEVRWSHFNESNPQSTFSFVNFWEWSAQIAEDGEFKSRLFPTVDKTNGTLSARIPLSTIGDPKDGVRFKNLSANSMSATMFTGISQPGTPVYVQNPSAEDLDEANEILRLFAVGGPEVWNELRGIDPTETDEENIGDQEDGDDLLVAWYANPLAAEHLPDTFQILGGILGVLAFIWGVVIVRRRRRKLAQLLEEVERAVKENRDDPQAALAALDRLETRFDTMLEMGKLQEHQHSTLLTKIERVGYRLVRQADGQTAGPSEEKKLLLE